MNISGWMSDLIDYKKFLGRTATDDEKYSEFSKVKSRVELKNITYPNQAGKVIGASGTIISKIEMSINDVFVYKGIEYKIVRVNEYKTKSGIINHYESYFV